MPPWPEILTTYGHLVAHHAASTVSMKCSCTTEETVLVIATHSGRFTYRSCPEGYRLVEISELVHRPGIQPGWTLGQIVRNYSRSRITITSDSVVVQRTGGELRFRPIGPDGSRYEHYSSTNSKNVTLDDLRKPDK